MNVRDHRQYHDEIGAYLLGALTELERQAFERHVAGCAECRDELERLRPAADALPRGVEQVEPPPSLKASLMEVVEREAREHAGAPAARERRPRRLRLPSLAGFRPALVAGALALGLLAGFGVAQLAGGGEDTRTLAATVDQGALPDASASLKIQGDGEDGAILSVEGMPPAGEDEVYQAWVERDGRVEPQPTFEPTGNGGGAVAVPDDLSDAQAVLVTREPRGGSQEPSEQPVISVPIS
jgi:anti-sigma-K factor RskA